MRPHSVPLETPESHLPVGEEESLKQHECIHDYPEIQNLVAQSLAATAGTLQHEDLVQGRQFQAKAPAPLRVVVSSLDLTTSGQYCASAGSTAPDFGGSRLTCTADDVLTAAKRSMLLDDIVPEAIRRLSARLKVVPMTSNLMVSSGACSGFTKPASHSSSGVPNADFVLYLASGPMSSGGVIAWAGACQMNSAGRSIVGRASFNPRWLKPGQNMESFYDTLVHELLHALGFSPTFFGKFASKVYRRGKTVTVLKNMPTLLSFARQRFNCPTLDGVEVEDEFTSGTGSHLERRLFYQDVMTGAGGESVSDVVLAVLGDLGVGYYPNYATADPVEFGKNAGCSFITEKCNTVAGGKNKQFCFTPNAVGCTHNRKAIGKCGVASTSTALPSYFQYFADTRTGGSWNFLDKCPLMQPYSNRICVDTAYAPTASETSYGFTYGANSRCVATSTNFIKAGYSGTSQAFRCLRIRCPRGSRVQVSTATSGWINCPTTGAAGRITVPGYSGYVDCPAARDICDSGTYYSGY
jgi:leishmanolysin